MQSVTCSEPLRDIEFKTVKNDAKLVNSNFDLIQNATAPYRSPSHITNVKRGLHIRLGASEVEPVKN
jgi:hypothetical protein